MDRAVLAYQPFLSLKSRHRVLTLHGEKTETRGLIRVFFDTTKDVIRVCVTENIKVKESFVSFKVLMHFATVVVFGKAQPSKFSPGDYDFSDWDVNNHPLPPPKGVEFSHYSFQPVYYPGTERNDSVHLWSKGRAKNDSGFHFALDWHDFMVIIK